MRVVSTIGSIGRSIARGQRNGIRRNNRIFYVMLDHSDLGSPNHANLDAVQRILADAVELCGDRIVEVELNTSIIGASFVGILAQFAAQMRSQGGRLTLPNGTSHVRTVLAVCGYEWLAP